MSLNLKRPRGHFKAPPPQYFLYMVLISALQNKNINAFKLYVIARSHYKFPPIFLHIRN